MAGYDSYRPGRTDPLPGLPTFMAHDSAMSAPGSAPTDLPDTSSPLGDRVQQGTVGSSAVVYGAYDSLATADVVTVGPLDTMVPREADLYAGSDPNPLSSVPGDQVGHTGAGGGHVVTSAHPNAGS